MDNESSNHRQNSPKSAAPHSTSPLFPKGDESADGDPEVWAAFTANFSQVQSVLDRNRSLIQQVNENHRSKIQDNLVKNVELIQEINGNIAKVVSLYSNLSADFSSMFHQRNSAAAEAKSKAEEKSSE
ncbi:protein EARLY FLOWERING 4-like [Primulina eburnea]|uniref:protein EARLY FLOWERING 4-like n=1 Tax=Primulina eburnea TaxID=1245227 RepID=UPI003C6C8175